MAKITLDTETTGLNYDVDKVIGLAYCTGKKADYKLWDKVDKKKLKEKLLKDDCRFHNAKFDIHMLRAMDMPTPNKVHDTMIATHLLDETGNHRLETMVQKYLGHSEWKSELQNYYKDNKLTSYQDIPLKIMRPYAAKDALYTHQLADKTLDMVKNQGMWDLYCNEMELIKAIVDIEERGVMLDIPFLKKLKKQIQPKLKKLEKTIYKEAGCTFNIASEDKVIDVIYNKLGLPVIARSWKTRKPAVDKDTLVKLKHRVCDLIAEYRLYSKLLSTYIESFIEKAPNSVLKCEFDQMGTRTGRFSSRNPNLQNIPRQNDIRKAFICRPDYYNFYFDYKQMELVLYAHFSQDPYMIEAIKKGKDLHGEMAFRYFGTRDYTKEQRNMIKMINFGIIYGMGANGLSQRLDISKDEAFKIRNRYFGTFPAMKKFNYDLANKAASDGCVINPFGRKRKIDNDKGYLAVNTKVQGTCGDILKHAMVKIHNMLKPYKSNILLTIHDEIVCEIHKRELDLVEVIKQMLEDFKQFDLPLSSEVAWTKTSWADKKSWEGKVK